MTHATITAPNGTRLAVRGVVQEIDDVRSSGYYVATIEVAAFPRCARWAELRADWRTNAENALLAAWSRGR